MSGVKQQIELIPACEFQDCPRWSGLVQQTTPAQNEKQKQEETPVTYAACSQYLGVQLNRYQTDFRGSFVRDYRPMINQMSQKYMEDIDAERQGCVDQSSPHCKTHVDRLLRAGSTSLVDFTTYNNVPYIRAQDKMQSVLYKYLPTKMFSLRTLEGCNPFSLSRCSTNYRDKNYSGYIYLTDPQAQAAVRKQMCKDLQLPDAQPEPVRYNLSSCECGHCYKPAFCSNDLARQCVDSTDCDSGTCVDYSTKDELSTEEQTRMNSHCKAKFSCGAVLGSICETQEDCGGHRCLDVAGNDLNAENYTGGYTKGLCEKFPRRYCSIAIDPTNLRSQSDCETMGGRWKNDQCTYKACNKDADCGQSANGSVCIFTGTSQSEPDADRAFWDVNLKRCSMFRERDTHNQPIVPSVINQDGKEIPAVHYSTSSTDYWQKQKPISNEASWVSGCVAYPMKRPSELKQQSVNVESKAEKCPKACLDFEGANNNKCPYFVPKTGGCLPFFTGSPEDVTDCRNVTFIQEGSEWKMTNCD